MDAARKRIPSPSKWGEIGRKLTGVLLELGFKAYGTAAALSVALSDSETTGGKLYDALTAVPNLMERYRQARYVFDHAEEIQATLDYLHQHAPNAEQIEAAAQQSYETIERARTMLSEIDQAQKALSNLTLVNFFESAAQAVQHLSNAWNRMPDFDSVSRLADLAHNITPMLKYLNNWDIDFVRIYESLLCVLDNFANDEIAGTLISLIGSLVICSALGTAAGFWSRRGRPGILTRVLQGWGARFFSDWYTRNLEYVLSPVLYAVAHRRIQGEIVADPLQALDPECYRRLEKHFERRLRENPTAPAR